jgi:hypothetical protein
VNVELPEGISFTMNTVEDVEKVEGHLMDTGHSNYEYFWLVVNDI